KYAEENKLSLQEAARNLRYEWFEELVVEKWSFEKETAAHALKFVLTAHHAGDNAETVLMNFCRGTGLHGLTGIPLKYGNITRPLLSFTKEELLNFAKENKLDFVEDSSNLSSHYTRNLFRNEILPAISKVFPKISDNLNDNINRFKEIESLFRFSVGEIRKKLCKIKGAEIYIPVKQFIRFGNRALIYEIISEYGFSEKQVDEVIKLAASNSGKYIDSPGLAYRIIKHRHWFIISPVNSAVSGIIVIEKADKTILFEEGFLKMDWLNHPPASFKKETVVFDAKEIEFPLLLRKWKTGDYFYPLGMKKKKKVSRFLIDQKLSKTAKDKVWVLESNKRIIWVLGLRIDDRFKVTEKTKSVLQLKSESS
ncbi:MAG TPA: tRNA lysidine(34) synthetase TilS, partial [Chitinophagaceae bacterium]|nr:tRNA lysidine(34) synthetase TilS [Chitinophagaceae bacterium]